MYIYVHIQTYIHNTYRSHINRERRGEIIDSGYKSVLTLEILCNKLPDLILKCAPYTHISHIIIIHIYVYRSYIYMYITHAYISHTIWIIHIYVYITYNDPSISPISYIYMYMSHAYTSHVIYISYTYRNMYREKKRERQRKTEGAGEKEKCKF